MVKLEEMWLHDRILEQVWLLTYRIKILDAITSKIVLLAANSPQLGLMKLPHSFKITLYIFTILFVGGDKSDNK